MEHIFAEHDPQQVIYIGGPPNGYGHRNETCIPGCYEGKFPKNKSLPHISGQIHQGVGLQGSP